MGAGASVFKGSIMWIQWQPHPLGFHAYPAVLTMRVQAGLEDDHLMIDPNWSPITISDDTGSEAAYPEADPN